MLLNQLFDPFATSYDTNILLNAFDCKSLKLCGWNADCNCGPA